MFSANKPKQTESLFYPGNHHHVGVAEARVLVEIQKRWPDDLDKVKVYPAQPIAVCKDCRARLVETIVNDKRRLSKGIHHFYTSGQHNAPEVRAVDDEVRDLIRIEHLLKNQPEGYRNGKTQIVVEEELILSDPEVILARIRASKEKGQQLEVARATGPLARVAEATDMANVEGGVRLFLSTLFIDGPTVLGDEGFQKKHRKTALVNYKDAQSLYDRR